MLATIQLSAYDFVQGVVVRRFPSGDVVISHAGREYVGQPVSTVAKR